MAWHGDLNPGSFPLLRRACVATPAQYRIKLYLIGELRQTDADEALLRIVERALRIQHIQVDVDPLLIAEIGEPVGFRGGIHQ